MPEQPGTILTQPRIFIRKRLYEGLTVDKIFTAHQYVAGRDFMSFTLFLRQMYFSVKRLFLLLRQSMLFVIYGAFFLVQFFCITGSDNATRAVATVAHYKEPGKEKVFTAKNDHSKKTKVRLNKRFEPAIAEGILNAGEDVPIKYISNNQLSNAKDYLLISFILSASLRGPPVPG